MKNAWHFLFLNVKWQFAKGIFVLYMTVMILIMYIFFILIGLISGQLL